MALSKKEQISLSFNMFARTQSPDYLDFLSEIIRTFAQVFPTTDPQTMNEARCSIFIWAHMVSLVDSLSKCNLHTVKLKL